jgi:biopolymer transport protein ExbD
MRFADHGKGRRQPSEINVTSLVDIIFNLLLFFLLTTSFSQTSGLEIQLPSANASDMQVSGQDLVVVLTKDGFTLIDGKSVGIAEVEERIAALKNDAAAGAVVVQADSEVAHGRVVEVIDAAKRQKVKSVAIATQGGT